MTKADSSSSTPKVEPIDRQNALTDIYTEATKWLRSKYQDEFNAKRKELADARGIEWTPKPTPQDKARATIEKLLAEHPALATEIAAQQAEADQEAAK